MGSLKVVSLDELADPEWDPECVTHDVNALGFAPQRILFLWPFARPINLRAQVIGHGWAQIGPVHLLLRPGWHLMRWVLDSTEDVYAALDDLSDAPGKQKAPQLRFGDGIWRPYYGYPVHPLTVHDEIWQEVIQLLVDRCVFFVADMTAKHHAGGLAFELDYLFNWVDPSRIILLVDSAQADVPTCRALVEACWNSRQGDFDHCAPPPIFLYDSQSRPYVKVAFKGAFKGQATLPIAAKALGYLG